MQAGISGNMKRQVNLTVTMVLLLPFIVLLFLARGIIQLNDRNTNINITPSFRISYTPPQNATKNQLMTTFEKVMSSPGEPGGVLALLIENGKIMCRGSHYEAISKSRTRWYIQILNRAEQQMHRQLIDNGSLPVMLVGGDASGCINSQKVDQINFPRLTWHTPAPKYGTEWCQAICMVGYEMWVSFQKMHAYYNDTSLWFHGKSNRHYPTYLLLWPQSKTGKTGQFQPQC